MTQSSWSKKRVMIDTNAIIRYLGVRLKKENPKISIEAKRILDKGFGGIQYTLFLSSISILEMWSNLEKNNNSLKDFQTLVKQLYESSYIRVTDLTSETLSQYNSLGEYKGGDGHGELRERDRIIYATSQEFECDIIISSDISVKSYAEYYNGPTIVSS